MISLLIDTCSTNIVIGLLKEEALIDKVIDINDNNLSTRFVTMIDNIFKKNDIDIKDVDKIFIAVGPGSFTGIRVGVTFAKVMAWTLNKKVIPFSSLELMATTEDDSEVIVPMIDARRGYVFAGAYSKSLDSVIGDRYVLLGDLINDLSNYNDVVYISNDTLDVDTKKANYNIEKLVKKHMSDEGVDPHTLNPVYLKKTEAEEKLGS